MGPFLGSLVVSRVNTENEGWAAQRPHCGRTAFSSHVCLVSYLPVGTPLSTRGHVPSRRKMQTSLPGAEEVMIGARAWYV